MTIQINIFSEVVPPFLQFTGQQLSTLYLNSLGVQITYTQRGLIPLIIWAFSMPTAAGEVPVLELNTDVGRKGWKIPAQTDAFGNPWPNPNQALASEDTILDSNNKIWYVVEEPGAVLNLDNLNAIWQLNTENRHTYRVH